MTKKILIINPFGIGDVIFSTPIIEILRKKFPDSFIAYVCNRRVSELLSTNPNLDKIFIYEKDEYRDVWNQSRIAYFKKLFTSARALRSYKFNVLIDLSLTYQYSMLAKIIGIKERIGFNYRNRGRFLTKRVDVEGFDSKHVIDYYLEVLSFLGIDVKKHSVSPKIYISEELTRLSDEILKNNGVSGKDLLIGVVPGCGASWGADAAHRRWDKENFAVLIDKLIEKYNAKIIMFGNKKEAEICDDIQKMIKNKVINYCGKTSIPEMAALMSKCALIVSNDGGPLHMAVGLGIRTVSIFGPVDEKIYGPYSVNGTHKVIFKKGLECRPCYRKFKYRKCDNRLCLNGITVEDVLSGVESILKK